MKKHSSKPTKQDVAILCYRVGETSVNMPIKNRNQIKLFKEPAFKVIGLWKPKNDIGKAKQNITTAEGGGFLRIIKTTNL